MTIQEILGYWRLSAQDCGRLAEGFIRNGSPDRAWAASMMAFHYAGNVWTWENDPEHKQWMRLDRKLTEAPMGCEDDSSEFDLMRVIGE